jgi:CHAT domain-containing protein/tetratricopeptide (TPR) repeat protein
MPPTDVAALFDQLAVHRVALLEHPSASNESRRAALTWFRAARDDLLELLRQAPTGPDPDIVESAQRLAPFLIATADWAGLVTVCRLGLRCVRKEAAAARLPLLHDLGVGLQRQDERTAATRAFDEVIELATELADHVARGEALTELGRLSWTEGETEEAARLLQRAALAHRLAVHPAGEARAVRELAKLMLEFGDHDSSAAYAERARLLFHEVGDRAGEARALRVLAAGSAIRDQTGAALSTLDQAVALFDEAGDDEGAAEATHAAARLHREAGNLEAARSFAEEAVRRAVAGASATVAELTRFRDLVVANAAVAALLAADSDPARAAVVAERPELLGGYAQVMMIEQGENLRSTLGVDQARIDAALDLLSRRSDGYLADRIHEQLRSAAELAGPDAELPSELPELIRRLAVVDDPQRRRALLTSVIGVVSPAELPVVRAYFLLDMAKAMFAGGAGSEDRERAIEHAMEAERLSDSPQGRRQWAHVLVFLGIAWRQRKLGDPADNVDRALNAFRRALTVFRRRSDPQNWAAIMVNLANVYWQRRGTVADLNRAVHRHTAALTVFDRVADERRWATVQSNIGLVLTEPAMAGDPANLEAGRRALLAALETSALRPLERASALINLSQCYRLRTTGDLENNLDSAVRLATDAYDLMCRFGSSLDRSNAACAIGDAERRAARQRGLDPLAAVEWYERALELAPVDEGPQLHAAAADSLAGTLALLTNASPADWRRAIELHETAMAVYEQLGDRMEHARVCYNLATTLLEGQDRDVERAIGLLERSLITRRRDLVPLDWAESMTALAGAWQDHPERPDPVRAVELLAQVVEVVTPTTAPDDARRAWSRLGSAYSDLGRWGDAAAAYEQALAATELRYRAIVLPGGKDAELQHVADVPWEAAHAAAAAGDAERAAVILEASRARSLGARLQRDRADLAALEAVSAPAAATYRTAVDRLRALEARQRLTELPDVGDPNALRASMTDAQAQLDAAVGQIRGLPGFATFLGGDPMSVLGQAALSDLPLVYLAVARHGAVAVIVTSPRPHAAPDVQALRCPLTADQLAAAASGIEFSDDDGLAQLLVLLGAELIEPLARRLRTLGAPGVVLIATGALGGLPLHAARYGSPPRRLIDEIDVSYAPSARVLLAARGTAGAARTRPLRLVGVAEPQPCDPPLPWASAELAAAAALFNGNADLVPGATATAQAVLDALPAATHLHFAGHGYYDPVEPLDSYLALAGGDRLRLRDLLDSNAMDGVRLVVASACQTAVTDLARLPDEAIGLPAGLVQAGAGAVIGTLWEVNDRAAALVVARFYTNHLRGDPEAGTPPMPPARALADAQRWLSAATTAEIDRFAAGVGLRRLRSVDHRRGAEVRCTAAADGAGTPARSAVRPSHWAAFILVGDGG